MKTFNLFLIIEEGILMLFAEAIHSIFGFELGFLQQFAKLLKFSFTLAVGFNLAVSGAFSIFQAVSQCNKLNTQISAFTFNLKLRDT